jgi:hypothetical protein
MSGIDFMVAQLYQFNIIDGTAIKENSTSFQGLLPEASILAPMKHLPTKMPLRQSPNSATPSDRLRERLSAAGMLAAIPLSASVHSMNMTITGIINPVEQSPPQIHQPIPSVSLKRPTSSLLNHLSQPFFLFFLSRF